MPSLLDHGTRRVRDGTPAPGYIAGGPPAVVRPQAQAGHCRLLHVTAFGALLAISASIYAR